MERRVEEQKRKGREKMDKRVGKRGERKRKGKSNSTSRGFFFIVGLDTESNIRLIPLG